MISKHQENGLTWIDLEQPTHDELRSVALEWNIHPSVAEKMSRGVARGGAEMHPHFIYFNLNFPVLHRKLSNRPLGQEEIGFVIGRDFIVTVRYDSVDSLHRFGKMFEVDAILARNGFGNHAGFAFFHMVRLMYETLLRELDSLGDSVRTVEENIFKGQEQAMVVKISEVGRELLDAKRTLRPHRETLEAFAAAGRRLFGEEFDYYSETIKGDYEKVVGTLESIHESVVELRETNNALLSTKQNSIIQVLTVVAFIALPLTIITSLFQIDTVSRPIVGMPYDFWLITGLQIFIALVMYVIFRIKKWL